MNKLDLDRDPHSYYRNGQPKITHVEWGANVLFDEKVLECEATLHFNATGPVDLDTRDLHIRKISGDGGVEIPFTLSDPDPVLGSKLSFEVPKLESGHVRIEYRTSPNASALQWLSPEQTESKKPFMFSQGEEIHTRSFLPCQDTPGVRFTFEARLAVPDSLRGLMAAPQHMRLEDEGGGTIEVWKMPYRIPSYLFAIAVGDLESRELSDRSKVWAQPQVVEAAAKEFEDIPAFMKAGERLFGDYPWERYDVLVLPWSFPYGGMENPCLTFVTPALICGDKSQVRVIAHELAHSWFGNLITNAVWSDMWLNEGFTVWAEGRIVEAVYGKDQRQLGLAMLAREHARDVERFALTRPLFASLAPDLAGSNPDDAFSRVPYFRGCMFVTRLEQQVGRKKFDAFVKGYIRDFKFQSITTAEFLDYAAAKLPRGTFTDVSVWRWVYVASLPDDMPRIASPLISEVEAFALKSKAPPKKVVQKWRSSQWGLYLELLPRPVSFDLVMELERKYELSTMPNTDVRWAYLLLAAESGFEDVDDDIEYFLGTQGRMKYLNPLYKALAARPECRARAEEFFKRFGPTYHPVAASQVRRVLAEAGLAV